MNELLMIFVRNLIPGMVKTRLAEDIGIYKALDVYMELVNHTHHITRKLEVDKAVYYSEYVEIEDIWDDGNYELKLQKGNTLGEKMSVAFDEGFDSYHKVIIIGSDCYELSGKVIKEAFVQLEENDLVIGPAKDGGFYLLGMKEYLPQLFENKTYSTHTVLQELMDEADELELKYHLLPALSDVDTLDDLKASGMKWEQLGEEEETEGELGGDEYGADDEEFY